MSTSVEWLGVIRIVSENNFEFKKKEIALLAELALRHLYLDAVQYHTAGFIDLFWNVNLYDHQFQRRLVNIFTIPYCG